MKKPISTKEYLAAALGTLGTICFLTVFVSLFLFPTIGVGGSEYSTPVIFFILTFIFIGSFFLLKNNRLGILLILVALVVGIVYINDASGKETITASDFKNPAFLEFEAPAGKMLGIRLEYEQAPRDFESDVEVTTTTPDGTNSTISFEVGQSSIRNRDSYTHSYTEKEIVSNSVAGKYTVVVKETNKGVLIKKVVIYSKE